jgi:hypothetical protein
MEPSGRIVCHSLNSPIIIVTKLAYRWPTSKPYMAINAKPLSTGLKLEKAKCLALISSRKPKSKCS